MEYEGVFICKFGDNFRLCRVKAQDLAVIGNTKDFDDLDDAFAEAKVIISYEKKPFKAIIRYDKGLGVEYLTVPGICAKDEAEAEVMALEKSGLLGNKDASVSEVKIRNQN